MRKSKIIRNPYLLFSPFLIAFIVYVFISPTDGNGGDEVRYLLYAENLTHGFYSPPGWNGWLINGPGYPIVLVPFVALKLPFLSMTIINAFFYYFSIILLFKALNKTVSYGVAILFSFAWASYMIAYQNIPFIHTETFTYLLITLLIYSIVMAYDKSILGLKNRYVIMSGLFLGYIVLTKMIFGYVLLVMLLGSLILWILNRNNLNHRKSLFITILALITTTPYLLYTYNQTGKIFYWGSGSDSLYWMTSPSNVEYGDWTGALNRNNIGAANYNIVGADSLLAANHQDDFNKINKSIGIERDDVYKSLALRNIKAHPLKYAQNIIYNMGRLVFHYPFSQAIQKPRTLLILPINGILLTLMLFSLIPTILNWRIIPIPLKFLLMLTFFYLGASTLVTALVRMFTIIVPILLFWIAYITQHTLSISLKFKINEEQPSL